MVNYLICFAKKLDACKRVTEMMIWRGEGMRGGDFSAQTLDYWSYSQPDKLSHVQNGINPRALLSFLLVSFFKGGK